MAKTHIEKSARGKTTTKSTAKSKDAGASAGAKTSDQKTATSEKAKTTNLTDKKRVTSSPRDQSKAAVPAPSPEERYRMVQDAAYHIAEKDGFRQGQEQDYWLQAERQIDEMLKSKGTGVH